MRKLSVTEPRRQIPTYLPESIYNEYKQNIGQIPVATHVRMLIEEFNKKCKDQKNEKR